MERLARILMVATRASASTVGLVTIAVRTSTIASMLLVSTEPLVSMVLVALAVAVHPERLDYCVTWMMHVLQIPAMLMPFVKRAQLMDLSLAHVLKATKVQTAQKTLMNVSKVNFIKTIRDTKSQLSPYQQVLLASTMASV